MELFILVIGLCIGSFLNVCIYRIQREESIAFPPSHCTSCGYELKWKDLIPIISYLSLKGKCRKCDEKIAIKYPLVELINSIIYLLVFYKYGLTLEFVMYCIFASILIVIAVIDYETKEVYTLITIFAAVIGVIFIGINLFIYKIGVIDNILGALIGYGVIYLIVILTRGMGEGDAEIAGICGLFLGVKGAILTLFVSFILGGIIAVIILCLKLKNRKEEIAFGPYLAIAGIIFMIWGSEIMSLYVKNFLNY